MYEKHRHELQKMLSLDYEDEHPALQAAIELMRTAEPKDAAAEREHCFAAAHDNSLAAPLELADLLMRERAAARAEGVAQTKLMLEMTGLRLRYW